MAYVDGEFTDDGGDPYKDVVQRPRRILHRMRTGARTGEGFWGAVFILTMFGLYLARTLTVLNR